MSEYTPRKGSYPALAWDALGPDGELSTGALAEAIGARSDIFQQIMAVPLTRGYLTKERRNGLNWRRRGNGTPPARVTVDEDTDDTPFRRPPPPTAAKGNGAGPPSSVFDLAAHQPADDPEPPRPVIWPGTRHASTGEATSPANGSQTPAGDAVIPPAKAGSAFRCALFNDGELRIEWRGQIIELEPAHTRALFAYLDRLALEPTA